MEKHALQGKVGLMWALLADEDTDEELELEEMLADKDLLTSLMEELREVSPGAGEVLIDERDEFIARKISEIRGDGKVLAVLGAGHLDGVSKLLAEDVKPSEERISELAMVPKGGGMLKTISYAIPVAVFALLGWFAYNGDLASIKENGNLLVCRQFHRCCTILLVSRRAPDCNLCGRSNSIPNHFAKSSFGCLDFNGINRCWFVETGLCTNEGQGKPTGEDLTEFLKGPIPFWILRNCSGPIGLEEYC